MFTLFLAPEEATIIATGGNSAGSGWDNSHTGLTDNDGLGGSLSDVSSQKCAGMGHKCKKIGFCINPIFKFCTCP